MTVVGTVDTNERNKNITFKNNALFRSWISKINNTLIDNAEDLDIAMSMRNLIEYSGNYSMTSRCFWNYYRDEVNNDANENNDAGNHRENNNKTATSKSFKYRTKIMGNTPADNNTLDTEVVVPLKYLSNFRRSLDLPLVYCEVELDLLWSRNCIISEISRTDPVAVNSNANLPV